MQPDMSVLFVNDLGGWYRLEGDRCAGEFEVTEEMLGPDGSVRASILATQADMIGGALANRASAPRVPLTVDLTVHRVEPVGVGTVAMVARILRAGRRTVVTEAAFVAGGERPLVVSQATFMPSPNPVDEQPFVGDRDGGRPSLARPFADQLGIRVLAPGVTELDRVPYTMQPTGTIQGGGVAAVAEVAAETACGAAVLDIDVRFLAAVRVGPARATAEVLGGGRVRVEVRDRGRGDRLTATLMARVAQLDRGEADRAAVGPVDEVDEHTAWCPLGDGPLVRSMANGRHETCPGCKGFAVTIWLLEELLVDGAGGSIWRASERARPDGHPCPDCRAPMRRVSGPRGATVEVCRTCEVVWVDAEAQPLLPARPELAALAALAASGGVGSPDPPVCPTCGAPYSRTPDGLCRYCRAVVARSELETSAPDLAGERMADREASREWEGATDRYLDALAADLDP